MSLHTSFKIHAIPVTNAPRWMRATPLTVPGWPSGDTCWINWMSTSRPSGADRQRLAYLPPIAAITGRNIRFLGDSRHHAHVLDLTRRRAFAIVWRPIRETTPDPGRPQRPHSVGDPDPQFPLRAESAPSAAGDPAPGAHSFDR